MKYLPATPEPSQKLIWSCPNFVDVWASDVHAARQTAETQFQAKQDYDFGEFVAAAKTLGLFWLLLNEAPPAIGATTQ